MNEGENAMNESPTKPSDETAPASCTRGHVHFAMNDRRKTMNEGENAMNESPTKPFEETAPARCTRGHVHFAMNEIV